jgi:diadenosine tetraphosphate (Ap4A) HIT family hydrolase
LKHLRGKIVIDLPGDWTLNHYGGDEGFLGWLALQPRYHQMELTDLCPNQAAALGGNIQHIDIALRQYWSIHFKDPIERVYVVYFFESEFDEPKKEQYHLHIHLIPRTKQLAEGLRTEDGSSINAWDIPTLRKGKPRECVKVPFVFPSKYKVKKKDDQNAVKLMTHLRDYFQRLSGAK